MLFLHRLQLLSGPEAEDQQGCPLCATVAGLSWLLLSPCHHLRVPGEEPEEEPKVKTQWPRSADEPGLYMAQTGNSGHLPSSVAEPDCVACVLGVCRLCLCPGAQLSLPHKACGQGWTASQ
jgi:hypothetical protein